MLLLNERLIFMLPELEATKLEYNTMTKHLFIICEDIFRVYYF
uniref:Uncharacterized protein n=1 Tax=Anguilla anguilla TaxID=7936 RepID=A0A0E9RH12_ANGAN